MKYIYYILEKGNHKVSGVVSEDENNINYDELTLQPVYDRFQGCDVPALVRYHENPTRKAAKNQLAQHFGTIDLTKDYFTALAHAKGKIKKAVAVL